MINRTRCASVCTSLVFSSLLLISAGSVNAALVDNGNSLIDTDTNLEWLDLTQTKGWTVNQALASDFVTVDGYAYATTAQVTTLFANAGFPLAPPSFNNPLNAPAAELLLAGLGCTSIICGTTGGTGRGWADAENTFNYQPFYSKSTLGGSYAIVSLGQAGEDVVNAESGVYLVRTSVVPVPAAAWLFGSGLLGLIGISRRKKSA
jgi:hypothetical protein